MLSLRRSALVLALAALTGCESITAPGGVVAGTYALQSFGGASLPFVFTEAGDWRSIVVADTLRLELTGVGTRVLVVRTERISDPTVQVTEQRISELRLTTTDNDLRLVEQIGCLDVGSADCAGGFFFTRLTVDGARLHAGEYRYQRVGFGY